MERGWFDKSVPVVLQESGGTIDHVSSAAQAADVLLNHWPRKGGSRHLAARKACVDVLGGLKASMTARKAFTEAAREAHILVEE